MSAYFLFCCCNKQYQYRFIFMGHHNREGEEVGAAAAVRRTQRRRSIKKVGEVVLLSIRQTQEIPGNFVSPRLKTMLSTEEEEERVKLLASVLRGKEERGRMLQNSFFLPETKRLPLCKKVLLFDLLYVVYFWALSP